MISQLHDFKFFRDEIDVHCDIKCNGSLEIIVAQPPNNAAANRPPNSGKKSNQVGKGLPGKMITGKLIQRRTSVMNIS